MVQAQDLRIDNLLLLGKHDTYTKVFSLRFDRTDKWLVNDVPLSEYRPIPLTPDILLKAGFVLDFNDEVEWLSKTINGIEFCQGDKNGFVEVYLDIDDNIRVRYVHQLQNLIFALTQTEITITN